MAAGALFIPIDDWTRALAIRSSCGDGGYAAYWQFDAAGQPVSLIFDFADLAQPVCEAINLRPGQQ
jgi:hypothetical protein